MALETEVGRGSWEPGTADGHWKPGGQGWSFPRTCGHLTRLPASRPGSQHGRPWMWSWTWRWGVVRCCWKRLGASRRKPRIPKEKPRGSTKARGVAGSREESAGERFLPPAEGQLPRRAGGQGQARLVRPCLRAENLAEACPTIGDKRALSRGAEVSRQRARGASGFFLLSRKNTEEGDGSWTSWDRTVLSLGREGASRGGCPEESCRRVSVFSSLTPCCNVVVS